MFGSWNVMLGIEWKDNITVIYRRYAVTVAWVAVSNLVYIILARSYFVCWNMQGEKV